MVPSCREELARLGFPVPAESRYTVKCQWRPPKDHWPVLGARMRYVTVTINNTGDHHSAAIESCLFLITMNRGKCTALSVVCDEGESLSIDDVSFDWSWYDGVVTFSGEIVDVTWA
jgi:hypothetical protein